MDEKQLFNIIKNIIKVDENYIPRNYPTIGGMWTVDTYQKNSIKVQMMDEGYTTRIFAEGLEVYENYNGAITFNKGDINKLQEIANSLK